MSRSQHPSLTFDNQTSQSDEKDEVAHLRTGPPRVQIIRSNSAPQAESKFIYKQGGTPEVIRSSKSPSKNNHIPEEEYGIPTLSDGVIHVNHQQAFHAAACVLASHKHVKEKYPGGNGSTNVSKTPLCDTDHLPSTTECFFENSFVPSLNENLDDVWQVRENYQMPYHNMPGGPRIELRNTFAARADENRHQLNGVRKGSVPGSWQTFLDHQGVGNGSLMREHVAQSAVPARREKDLDSSDGGTVRQDHEHSNENQGQSENILPNDIQRLLSVASVKEKGYARLKEELLRAQKALELKDEEVDELKGIRARLMKEVSDFTAALFEEVNSQLNEAAINEQHARKQLMEAKSKIEVLSAEVAALKDLVLTSTPSSPNKHLHPQIDTSNKKEKGGNPFWKTHRRSTSHHQFTKESREKAEANEHHSHLKELDTGAFDEFQRWRLQPTMEFTGQFFVRVQQEDIQPCLNFKNKVLADKLIEGVLSNSLSIEPIPGDQSYPRKCCLSESHKLCNYKIKFEGDDKGYSISQMSRNRIAAVCDFYSYLRYIVQGLVKCSDKDMFAELVRLRNQMAQARLGLI